MRLRTWLLAIVILSVAISTTFTGGFDDSWTHYPGGITSMGIPCFGSGMMTQGKSVFVDPTNGSDDQNGLSIGTAVKTVAIGYGLLHAGQNDVLYYLAGASPTYLSVTLTWAKSYTHFVGICAEAMISQRARIFVKADATSTAITPMVNVTGNGVSFRNLLFNHGLGTAGCLVCVQITGDRCYFENVHFAGIGNNVQDVDEAASLKLNGAHENRFVNCSIGLDTVNGGSAATNCEIWFDGESSKNIFDNCLIYRRIEHNTNHPLVLVEDALGIGAFTIFRNCIFLNTSVNEAYTSGTIFNIPAIASKTRVIILKDCMATSGSTSAPTWDSSTRGIVHANMVAPTASAAGGYATNH